LTSYAHFKQTIHLSNIVIMFSHVGFYHVIAHLLG